jgi:hypothetical protein
MAVNTNGSTWRQHIQGTVAAKRTTIAWGEFLMTTLDPFSTDIGIDAEATMASAFTTLTVLAARFACLR